MRKKIFAIVIVALLLVSIGAAALAAVPNSPVSCPECGTLGFWTGTSGSNAWGLKYLYRCPYGHEYWVRQ